jgi:hypothetical protein
MSLSYIVQDHPLQKSFRKCCELGWPLPQSSAEFHREPSIFVFTKLTGVADGVRIVEMRAILLLAFYLAEQHWTLKRHMFTTSR